MAKVFADKEVTVFRHINASDVRDLCIKNGYYTFGDSSEYDEMLTYVRESKELTDEAARHIAEDIFQHSDIDRWCRIYGEDELGVFESILYSVYNAAVTFVQIS